jgi:hypothetical protein
MKKTKRRNVPSVTKPRFVTIHEGADYKIVDTHERIIVCHVERDWGNADADGVARDRAGSAT